LKKTDYKLGEQALNDVGRQQLPADGSEVDGENSLEARSRLCYFSSFQIVLGNGWTANGSLPTGVLSLFHTNIDFSLGPTTAVFYELREHVCYDETGCFTFATLMMVLYFIDHYSLRLIKKMSFSFSEKLNIFNIIYI
jgi:hypothetical protein